MMALTDWYCDDVLSGKLVVRKVFEDDRVVAFHHPRPAREVHVVVIPKAHVPSLLDEQALDGELLASMMRAIQHVARALGLDVPQEDRPRGFYVRANAAAPGVTPHMHWHILAPGAGAEWPESI
jgi:histidine triad (HIT) family protein